MMDDTFVQFTNPTIVNLSDEEDRYELKMPDKRMFILFEAFLRGYTVDEIFEYTKINRWFLYKFKDLATIQKIF